MCKETTITMLEKDYIEKNVSAYKKGYDEGVEDVQNILIEMFKAGTFKKGEDNGKCDKQA